MALRIAFFNHKGGVSKTTTAFHLGWMLAEHGKRVLLVDADPQCNLTGLILNYKGPSELEKFFTAEPNRNIRAGLSPAFESRPKLIEAVECVPVPNRDGLYLLPGHIRFAEYETTLGFAQELSGALQTLQNLPGAISYLIEKTAQHHSVDYVIIDMGPSLGPINQNIFTTSDYFLVPTAPDYFDVMAIDSLFVVVPRWMNWANKASSMPLLQNAEYPFPSRTPKFLGTIIQRYKVRGGKPVKGFKTWFDEINQAVVTKLAPALQTLHMTLSANAYHAAGVVNYCLAEIPDFNSLIGKSQDHQTPVFALTKEQLGLSGYPGDTAAANRDEFHKTFSELSTRVVALTSPSSSV